MNKRAMVLEAVQEHGPISSAELTDRVGLPRMQVNYYLTALKKKQVVGLKKGRWYFTPGMAMSSQPKPKPKPKPKPEPKAPPASILLSLTIAREALDDAIKKVESLEQLIYGEQ